MANEKERSEILLEEIRGSIKLLAEGHEVIRNEMKEMRKDISEQIKFVDNKVDFLGADLRDIKKTVNRIDLKLEEHIHQPAHMTA